MAKAPNNLQKNTNPLRQLGHYFSAYWQRRKRNKLLVIFVSLVLFSLLGMYATARWYMWTERNKPFTMGVSFIPDYASYLGLDPQKTMDALISDVHVHEFRLTSYWGDSEISPGKYDFTQLDWQFQKAETAHAQVILSVGLRQPRWPECHAPNFYDTSKPESQWYPQLRAYITAVVNRYKNSPALVSYQLENEYFLKGFGTCTDHSRSRLINEYALVKGLDPSHNIVVGRSNNDLGTPIGKPTPDEFSVSVYQRVWDAAVTHRYIQYPFPAWYYGFLAGVQKITTGKDMIIGELQAEAWPPNGQTIPQTTLSEQNKSFNARRLESTIDFGKATGTKTINLWGAEYWYYRKVKLNDPSVWNTAKQEFSNLHD